MHTEGRGRGNDRRKEKGMGGKEKFCKCKDIREGWLGLQRRRIWLFCLLSMEELIDDEGGTVLLGTAAACGLATSS
jgi:hypothetical protein